MDGKLTKLQHNKPDILFLQTLLSHQAEEHCRKQIYNRSMNRQKEHLDKEDDLSFSYIYLQ
jgi:hypothetical protein